MHHGLLAGCGQGHVFPLCHAVSRLMGTSMQGHVIPISRAVSRLMGTSCTMDCLEAVGKDA